MDRIYGKEIDILQLKKPVISDLKLHLKKIKKIVTYLSDNEQPISQNFCYICGECKVNEIVTIHGFSYVECAYCGHVYLTQRYSEEAIHRFYSNNRYYSEVTYANTDTCFYRLNNVTTPKVEFAEKYLNLTQGTWLDVGSGVGDIIAVLRKKGWSAYGLELSDFSVEFAKNVFQIQLFQKTLCEFFYENDDFVEFFDVVSFIGLLEHVVDPIAHLNLAYSSLKKEGYIFIQVPNADSLASMIQTVFPENVFRHMSPIEHIMVFTENSLLEALKRTGFKPLVLWYHGLDIYELLNNLVMINEQIMGSKFYNQFIENLNELQLVFDKKGKSDRIICIAQKIDK